MFLATMILILIFLSACSVSRGCRAYQRLIESRVPINGFRIGMNQESALKLAAAAIIKSEIKKNKLKFSTDGSYEYVSFFDMDSNQQRLFALQFCGKKLTRINTVFTVNTTNALKKLETALKDKMSNYGKKKQFGLSKNQKIYVQEFQDVKIFSYQTIHVGITKTNLNVYNVYVDYCPNIIKKFTMHNIGKNDELGKSGNKSDHKKNDLNNSR